jgi:hypothetical protein
MTAPKMIENKEDSILAIMPNPLENYESDDESETEPLILALLPKKKNSSSSSSSSSISSVDETLTETVLNTTIIETPQQPVQAVVNVKSAHKDAKTSRYGRKIVRPERLNMI